MQQDKIKTVFGVVQYTKKGEEAPQFRWQKIGTGFPNKDGSINLVFDFFPTDPNTTIQVRDRLTQEEFEQLQASKPAEEGKENN